MSVSPKTTTATPTRTQENENIINDPTTDGQITTADQDSQHLQQNEQERISIDSKFRNQITKNEAIMIDTNSLKTAVLASINHSKDHIRVINYHINPNETECEDPLKQKKGNIFQNLLEENALLHKRIKKLENTNGQLRKQIREQESTQTEYIDKFLQEERRDQKEMIQKYTQFIDQLLADKHKLSEELRRQKNEILELKEENARQVEENNILAQNFHFVTEKLHNNNNNTQENNSLEGSQHRNEDSEHQDEKEASSQDNNSNQEIEKTQGEQDGIEKVSEIKNEVDQLLQK